MGFSNTVATKLYEEQCLDGWTPLSQLDDDQIDRICSAIRRDSKESIAEVAVTRLKLATFWIKHLLRTNRRVGHPGQVIVKSKMETFLNLREQKKMEDDWRSHNKEPEYNPMTLDVASAPKVFEKIQTILTRIRGVEGVPLSYVVRHRLEPPDEDEDEPFGDEDSIYASVDAEMIARAPIIKSRVFNDCRPDIDYEVDGPFCHAFIVDNKKVWAVLHALLSLTGAWQHVKKFSTKQDGRQTWRTLHNHFFGGDKVNLIAVEIITALKNLYYSGDRANYTFDKYCTAHVEQHNRHSALAEYGVSPLDENTKILYFQEGIKDESLNSVKASIISGKMKGDFQTFDSVMSLYMTFKRSQKSDKATSRVSALSSRSGGKDGGWGRVRGAGRGDPDARKKGLPSQAEIDKCTHIEKKRYPKEEYRKFTPAEKAKHWQLMNPGVTPGTGPTSSSKRLSNSTDNKIAALTTAMNSAVSVISSLTDATTKLAASANPETPPGDDLANRDNPALARQTICPKKQRKE